MKKIILTSLVLLTAVSLTACAKKPAETKATPTVQPAQEQTKETTATQSAMQGATPVPSFAPTNDEDVKTLDKSMDAVNLNDINKDSLDDLK